MSYLRRLIDRELDDLAPHLAAIAIEGAKGVGKTATAVQRAATIVDLSESNQRELVAADPDSITRAAAPVLVDEWQFVPEVWNVVKRAVDDDRTGGRFLLTGSAAPTRDVAMHSGAGRIVRLMMRPFAVCERGLETTSVSLGQLLSGKRPAIEGSTSVGLTDYAEEVVASGLPGIRDLPPRARRAQLDGYLSRALDHDLIESGVTVRRPGTLRSWLTSYAAATATTASYGTILDAATAGETDKPARQTVAGYRESLERLFLLDPLPAWVPYLAPLARLTSAPKHFLADPALATSLLGVGIDGLLRGEGDRVRPADGTLLGALIESLAALSVRAMAQVVEAGVGHLRTRAGEHEIDLIVEGHDRQIVALEVKLASTVTDADVRHLLWLRDRLGDRVSDLVVLTTGPHAYRRRDGVAVVPLALLGP